jgi:hypothetical protein
MPVEPLALMASLPFFTKKIGLPLSMISWLTRFNPGNAHVCGLSRHGALVGSDELDGD